MQSFGFSFRRICLGKAWFKAESKYLFAYYFDKENEVILCKMNEIQGLISAYIIKKHEQICSYKQARYIKDFNQDKR